MAKKAKDTIKVTDKIGPVKHYKIEAFRKHVRVTQAHRHKQYFEVVYLSEGTGSHWIDGIRYEIRPPIAFFLNRDQMHHWELTSEPEGYVAILKNTFLEQSKDDALKQLLQRIWYADCIELKTRDEFDNLFAQLVQKASLEDPYNKHVIDGLLKALLAGMLQSSPRPVFQKGIHLQLYTRYLDMILTQTQIQRRVNYYAAELTTTPQNLNAACRKATGLSASQILNSHILNEAKRLLIYTGSHVSEIAYQLNFKDASYFVKFFKKLQQQTPEAFRKLNFQNYHL